MVEKKNGCGVEAYEKWLELDSSKALGELSFMSSGLVAAVACVLAGTGWNETIWISAIAISAIALGYAIYEKRHIAKLGLEIATLRGKESAHQH